MSVGEQIRYLGMLSSVGATKKQKKKALYFEGAVLGAFATFLGIVLGLIVTFVSQNAINSQIKTLVPNYSNIIKYETHIS